MAKFLCLLRGHQKTPVAFSSQRFFCRRCGPDLGRVVGTEPPQPPAPATKVAKAQHLRLWGISRRSC